MNTRDKDVLLALSSRKYEGQRELAKHLGCSLGAVNISVQVLLSEGYIDGNMELTEKSRRCICTSSPKRAVLLAAGAGTVPSPFYTDKPRPLLEVHGEPLTERIIRQLHEVGIREIYVLVGFAKEQFEYLIDSYGTELIVNSEYASRNNLHSLWLAREHLENCYVVPCDIWFGANPFRREELYSWYAVSDRVSPDSSVRVNRKRELAVTTGGAGGNSMIGVSYLTGDDSAFVAARLETMDKDRRYEGSFWEETLYEGDKLRVASRVLSADDAAEISTVEELWRLDSPKEIPIAEISSALGVSEREITQISLLKKGTTNISFLFSCKDKRYILRMYCDRSNKLIDHRRETAVYETLSECGRSERVVYLNGDSGVRISEYMENARFCDPCDFSDVKRCMKLLRQFHGLHLSVDWELDLFAAAEYFEALWEGEPSVYRDYAETKKNVFSLKAYIDAQEKDRCLTHIDAVPDNFLISDDGIRLIDWEYAAMQDPHLDIAMFALYSMYKREQVDSLIDAYFTEGCSDAVRLKIYCYISVGGLLWSNWCEYRQKCGTQFGEYSLRQYRYAKDYYRIVIKELQGLEENDVQG